MRLHRLHLPGTVIFLIVLFASGILAPVTAPGLPESPLSTLVLVPILRFAMYVAGSIAVGASIIGGLLGGGPETMRLGSRGAAVYAIITALLTVAVLADLLAQPWWGGLDPQMLLSFCTQVDEGRYFLAQILIASIVAWVLRSGRTGLDAVFAIIAMVITVALPSMSGHSTAAVTHWVASAVMIVHLTAMHSWVGGVLVLAGNATRETLVAFGRLAAMALPLVLISGLASIIARVNDWNTALHDRWTLVLIVKILVSVALVVVAARTRRIIAQGIGDEAPQSDIVTATKQTLALEGSIMVTVVGLAVILARMANP